MGGGSTGSAVGYHGHDVIVPPTLPGDVLILADVCRVLQSLGVTCLGWVPTGGDGAAAVPAALGTAGRVCRAYINRRAFALAAPARCSSSCFSALPLPSPRVSPSKSPQHRSRGPPESR